MYFDVFRKKLVLEEGKVLPLTNDLVFKNVVKNEYNRDFLAKIINLVTNINYEYLLKNMIVIDTDIMSDNIYVHHNEQDVIVTLDNKFINIEMSVNKLTNKRKNEITAHKYAGNMYKKGEKYDKEYIFYQIAIEKYSIFKSKDLIIEVGLTDLKSGELETNEFKKYHVNLKNIPNKCYNELDERERYFKLFTVDDKKELEKISKGDKIMEKVNKTLTNLSEDSIFMTQLEKEQLNEYCNRIAEVEIKKEAKEEGIKEGKIEGRKEGIKEGKIEGKLETAKIMLNKKYPIETIKELTNLTEDEINELKKIDK